MVQPVIHITAAGIGEAVLLAEMARTTFMETYAALTDPLNLGFYVDRHFTPDQMARELGTPGFRYFIARMGDRAVGFAKLRTDRRPRGLEEKKCLEIERIYVLREFQGFQVGSELIRMTKELARASGDQVIWLQVWQRNDKAIKFYRQSGFVIFETAVFHFGNDVQQDFLMKYDLFN